MKENYALLYFSGTGNTEYIAECIQKQLRANQQQAKMLAVDQLWVECGRSPHTEADVSRVSLRLEEFLEGVHVLVLLYPVYAADIPEPLKSLFRYFPKIVFLQLVVVSTCAKIGGDCCYLPIKYLRLKGYKPVLTTYVKMPENFSIPIFRTKIENGEKLDRFYSFTDKAVTDIVFNLVMKKKNIRGKTVFPRILGFFQRLFLGRFKSYFRKNMYADSKCIRCFQCVNTCPMANISIQNNHPIFDSTCCMCMRCYSFCPTCAIQITKKTENTAQFIRYRGFNQWRPKKLYHLESS